MTENAKSNDWNTRIGTIIPVSNTTNEVEFNRFKPDGVTVHFTRVPLDSNPATDDFESMLDAAYQAAKELTATGADVILYGCTSGSMACPSDRLLGTMEDASGKPALSTAGAILDALETLDVSRIAMATPYVDATNEKERHFIERHGFKVSAIKGLGLGGSLEKIQKISRVPAADAYAHAKSIDSVDAEAVLICCTDFGTADVVQSLENELGKPVITSNTASFWGALRRAGIQKPVTGYGRLLSNY
ncbi:aspartate/glutamate racemase family protein [Alphaproteobacteria bacterium]|nr:aspartate/glutamate racemase family protein [Alphaproteobacteria bacterium]